MKNLLLALCGIGVGIAIAQKHRGPPVAPTIKIDSRVDPDVIRKIILDAVRRGGAYSKAVRG